jgi:non-specific serine/threonine protein kinase
MMRPTERAAPSPRQGARPRWSEVLRALREARGVTLDAWGARLGVSRRTLQRWERGERAPDPGAEAAIVAYCREAGLFRTYHRGPLAGLALTAELLQELLAEARWRVGGGSSHAGGPDEPAALASAVAARTHVPPAASSNLPAPLTSFVGREQEIAAVRRLQANSRLLTLTGAGGCGKTRLALEVARELLWAYPHGVWLVELAALADPALIPETVAAALGLQPTGSRPPLEDVRAFLRGRHILLVLDNCEHLLTACARLVEALLRDSPTLEVFTTSREPLGIMGETVWRVPPMAVPGSGFRVPSSTGPNSELGTRNPELGEADAVRLFVERARLHRPEFELTPQNAATVAAVCGQLDGIPLAIELAAARVKALSIHQLAVRLEDRFQLLTVGGRTALPRHQTLRAAMDWSYDLLSEPEQATFRRLSVFAGGFALEAAEAVCGEGNWQRATGNEEGTGPPLVARYSLPVARDDVLDLLASLVDKSLVIAQERDDVIRYRLLETIRQYAAEKRDASPEAVDARIRHLDWCLTLAETADGMFRGPRETDAIARLEQEHDNLRVALRWSLQHEPATALRLAAALARFWEARSLVAEGQAWLARALAAGAEAPAVVRARALRAAGGLAELRGEFATAGALHEQALILYRQMQDQPGIAAAQASLGWTAYRQGDYGAASAALSASLALYRGLGDAPGIANVQGIRGLIAQRQGDYAAAQALMEERLALLRTLGDRHGIADVLEDLATVAGDQGDGERQVALLEESLALFGELGERVGTALALGSLGMALWARGAHDRAPALLRQSLTFYRELNHPRGTARLLAYQSVVALYERAYGEAEALCRESLALYREVGDAWAVGRYLPVLATAAFGLGRPARAARLLGAAAALRGRLGTPLPPLFQREHDRAVAAVSRAMGEPRFAAAWDLGAAMSLEGALDHALSPADTA